MSALIVEQTKAFGIKLNALISETKGLETDIKQLQKQKPSNKIQISTYKLAPLHLCQIHRPNSSFQACSMPLWWSLRDSMSPSKKENSPDWKMCDAKSGQGKGHLSSSEGVEESLNIIEYAASKPCQKESRNLKDLTTAQGLPPGWKRLQQFCPYLKGDAVDNAIGLKAKFNELE
ncbi:hypothetical protein Clacol_004423 [Clathrus columnatus]|uniref:Uncharacterized protein n=1 Tax=Clathrus columnatus TaxID=1419009 RepID=A0AAV5A9F3_9AGAM|nr:hypothetical protein Clacol_004423 [Clathrus columnatus]